MGAYRTLLPLGTDHCTLNKVSRLQTISRAKIERELPYPNLKIDVIIQEGKHDKKDEST